QLIKMSTSSSPVPAKLGSAFLFDSDTANYVDVGVQDQNGELSISAWIKPRRSSGARMEIFSNGGGSGLDYWFEVGPPKLKAFRSSAEVCAQGSTDIRVGV